MALLKETKKKEEKNKKEKRVVRFSASGHEYAIPIDLIKEIIYTKPVHPVPGALQNVEGVINLRGIVIPVIDIRKKLKSPSAPLPSSEHILIVEAGGQKLGLIVDRVNEVMAVREEQIQSVETFVNQSAAYVAGIYRVDDRLIISLDLEQLWNATELAEIETALNSPPSDGLEGSPQNKRMQ